MSDNTFFALVWAMVFLFFGSVIGGITYTNYLENMEHIKQGHCLTPQMGTQREVWKKCK